MPAFIDSKDSEKIKERTRENVDNYDYRLDLGDRVGPFTFLALGDSGMGDEDEKAKYHVGERMGAEQTDFVLHLGDVVYDDGAKEGYEDKVIRPYAKWLKKSHKHKYNDMWFTTPFLPIYGNHDYYDLSEVPLGGVAESLNRFLRSIGVGFDIGSGSKDGRVFEKAFINMDKARVKNGMLRYDMTSSRGTRVPNRYYWFTYGNCAFYALDSNTLDNIAPDTSNSPIDRKRLQERMDQVENRKRDVEREIKLIRELHEKPGIPNEVAGTNLRGAFDELGELYKEETLLDKHLGPPRGGFDRAQFDWFERVLHHAEAKDKWKIVFLHHPLYSSDVSHVDDVQSIGIRHNLREVLATSGVNLVIAGHSHCFEWLQSRPHSGESWEAKERKICYVVSGGGRQVPEEIRSRDYAR